MVQFSREDDGGGTRDVVDLFEMEKRTEIHTISIDLNLQSTSQKNSLILVWGFLRFQLGHVFFVAGTMFDKQVIH